MATQRPENPQTPRPLQLSHTIRGPPDGATELWRRESTVPAAGGVAGVLLVVAAMQAEASSFLTDAIEAPLQADGKQ